MRRFKSPATFQKFLRSKRGSLPDIMEVEKKIYHMTNYDRDGRRVEYSDIVGHLVTGPVFGDLRITVETEDRYKTFEDATVDAYTLENLPF